VTATYPIPLGGDINLPEFTTRPALGTTRHGERVQFDTGFGGLLAGMTVETATGFTASERGPVRVPSRGELRGSAHVSPAFDPGGSLDVEV
jgi:hypothetical protein